MSLPPRATISDYFATLQDPRIDRAKRHKLLDIVTIAICGVICGADTWVDLEDFGKSKEAWFRQFLELPNGIPSHDTFGAVFARLDPDQFQACFLQWVQAIATVTKGQVVAIDGKTARRSQDAPSGKGAIHMVNAWATENRLVLGQAKVDAKSNEITAIPELLRLLAVSGCIVTLDAMGCQTGIARQVLEAGADYVLAVKENQGRLYEDVRDLFAGAQAFGFAGVPYQHRTSLNKGHGRIERRECWTIADEASLGYLRDRHRWAGLKAIAKVTAQREVDGGVTTQTRYYITSLPGDAAQLLHAVRAHWGIENELHWTLDVAFREDDSRVRKDHAPQNLAILRQIALNLLKQESTRQRGIKGKRLIAGWDEAYLLKVLLG